MSSPLMRDRIVSTPTGKFAMTFGAKAGADIVKTSVVAEETPSKSLQVPDTVNLSPRIPATGSNTFVNVASNEQISNSSLDLKPSPALSRRAAQKSSNGPTRPRYMSSTTMPRKPPLPGSNLHNSRGEILEEEATASMTLTRRSHVRLPASTNELHKSSDSKLNVLSNPPSRTSVVLSGTKWYIVDHDNDTEIYEPVQADPTTIKPVEPVAKGTLFRPSSAKPASPVADKLILKRKPGTATMTRRRPVVLDFERLKMTPREIRRQEIIYEIVVTERDYARDLRVLTQIRDRELMRPAAIRKVFSNLEELFNVSDELFSKICVCRAEALKSAQDAMGDIDDERQVQTAREIVNDYTVGDIFSYRAPFLRLYTVYCQEQANGSAFLRERLRNAAEKSFMFGKPRAAKKTIGIKEEEKLEDDSPEKQREKDKLLTAFLQYCSLRPECHSLDIFAFLLKPIQRMCSYPRLLQDLLNNTDSTHPDYQFIAESLAMVERTVRGLNERVRPNEDSEQARLIELRKRLTFTGTKYIGFTDDRNNKSADKLGAKEDFDLMAVPSRRVLLESSETGELMELSFEPTIDIREYSATQVTPRWLILCSDLFLSARPAVRGLKDVFSKDKEKVRVSLTVDLVSIVNIGKGGLGLTDVDTVKLGGSKTVYYTFKLSMNRPTAKIGKDDSKKKTLSRRRHSTQLPSLDVVTLTFGCLSERDRDNWIRTVKSACAEVKKEVDARKQLLLLREKAATEDAEFKNTVTDVDLDDAASDISSPLSMSLDSLEDDAVDQNQVNAILFTNDNTVAGKVNNTQRFLAARNDKVINDARYGVSLSPVSFLPKNLSSEQLFHSKTVNSSSQLEINNMTGNTLQIPGAQASFVNPLAARRRSMSPLEMVGFHIPVVVAVKSDSGGSLDDMFGDVMSAKIRDSRTSTLIGDVMSTKKRDSRASTLVGQTTVKPIEPIASPDSRKSRTAVDIKLISASAGTGPKIPVLNAAGPLLSVSRQNLLMKNAAEKLPVTDSDDSLFGNHHSRMECFNAPNGPEFNTSNNSLLNGQAVEPGDEMIVTVRRSSLMVNNGAVSRTNSPKTTMLTQPLNSSPKTTRTLPTSVKTTVILPAIIVPEDEADMVTLTEEAVKQEIVQVKNYN